MSWKSLITAGLFCMLASPVFAAPTMNIVKGGSQATGNLNANGDWVWTVQITPDQTIMPAGDTTGTPVAAELGLTSNRQLLDVRNADAVTWDTNNPADAIFNWETTYGTPLRPEGLEANFTGATAGTNVVNAATAGGHAATGVNATANQIFAAMGSKVLTASTATNFLTITAKGPSTVSGLTTSLQVSGSHGGNGRLAQINGGTNGGPYTTGNFDTFNGLFSRTAKAGDANLDNSVDGVDFGAWLGGVGGASTPWYSGDFNDDGSIDGVDFGIWLGNVGAGSGGGLAGGTVPEPTSIALMGLVSLMLGGLRLRKR